MIKFAGYNFEGPWSPQTLPEVKQPAVYAVLAYGEDGTYDLLYVDYAKESLGEVRLEEKWLAESGAPLFIAAHWLSEGEKAQELLDSLKSKYNPPYNE